MWVDTTKSEFSSCIKPVTFRSEGETLRGTLYLPPEFEPTRQLAGLVVTGSWTTIKEQMAGLYAQQLSKLGYVTLAFDFRNYGQSDGAPREYESPQTKIKDIQNAMTFLSSLDFVDSSRTGGLAVCASAGYMGWAVTQDKRFKSFVAVAPWIHDSELVKTIYGGEEGVKAKIQAGLQAKEKYEQTGLVEYVPAVSTADNRAAMFGNFTYYLDSNRGGIPQWPNRFAVMSWPEWLQFNAMPIAEHIDVPVLFIHSEQAAIPEGARRFYSKISSQKQFLWITGNQFDFYDQEPNVSFSVKEAHRHFTSTLKLGEANWMIASA